MFLEKRVYQGSSGKVYPNAFTDRVSHEKVSRSYRAIFLENEFIRLMVLPEIGGRIHVGYDKINDYDFFYRQTVIKPALVGLLGPWISGGVEFNWPQHHRPSTFAPVHFEIDRAEDGSCTVWLSEHEPMNRMKGMVGICLHPTKAYVEARVRLYNRTPLVQTFLWWANVGVHVHDQYQAFFPPDVSFVADHAKRAISSFPIAWNSYYGVDYKGVDLTWHKNIPVPTSYMVTESKYDFFGGYDHAKRAGVVHVADHHIAPGKKLWTWGNAEFGHAWDRNLTDSNGPYVELMAGVYTDNQPDFSFLHPFETRSFSQFWYPIQEIGPAKNANRLAAVNLEWEPGVARVGVCVTEAMPNARISLISDDETIHERIADLQPGHPLVFQFRSPAIRNGSLALRVFDGSNHEIVAYKKKEESAVDAISVPASEPQLPSEIKSNDVLYLTGLHLEQYRHATRSPEPYWSKALERDPLDSRSNNALGMSLLRRGNFPEAANHFASAIARLTERNPNPYDGEPYYNLGLALRYQGKLDEAYDAFYKAAWNYAWQSPAYYELATLDCTRGQFLEALEHLDRSLKTNVEHLKARNIKAAVLRHLGRDEEAARLVDETLSLDALDFFAKAEQWFLFGGSAKCELFALLREDAQTCLDIGFDYAEAGMWNDSTHFLEAYLDSGGKLYPMIFYSFAYFAWQSGDASKASEYASRAQKASPDYCFPARLEEMLVLEWACNRFPLDAKAAYYLGNLLYDKRRHQDAIRNWERSVAMEASFSIPWRNLGIAHFNIRHDTGKAHEAYARAFAANRTDARLLYELDQLEKRTGATPQERLARLLEHRALVDERDDLTTELITLYNQLGEFQKALELLATRQFSPWEGGEGLVSGQFVIAHLELGRALLEIGRAEEALEHFSAARNYPHTLGEGKHLLALEVHLDYFSGLATKELGRHEDARAFWIRAVEANCGTSWMNYFKAMSLRQLGEEEAARSVLLEIRASAEKRMHVDAKIDYFATSLPNFLLFEDDLNSRNQADCLFTMALAETGLENYDTARQLLQQVLSIDRNHLGAQLELRSLNAGSVERSYSPAVAKPKVVHVN